MTDNEAVRAMLRDVAAKTPEMKDIVAGIESHIDRGTDPKLIRMMLASLLTALGGDDGR